MSNKTDKATLFFLLAFVFWSVGGFLMSLLRDSSMADRVLGIEISQGNSNSIFYQYIFFGILVLIFSTKIKVKKELYYNSKLETKISLMIASFAILVKISTYGFLIFSGDYYSRFEVNANLLTNILPTVLIIVAIDFIYRTREWRNSVLEKSNEPSAKLNIFNLKNDGIAENRMIFYVILLSAISVLAGSRSTAFYAMIAILAYFYTNPIILKRVSGVNILLALTIIYFIGQLANVMRWFVTDISIIDIEQTFLRDSFPEYRSHSQAAMDAETLGIEEYGIKSWILNLSAYIFPGFIFEIFNLDRTQLFNQIWTDFFKIIVWGTKEALYGIRVGLIGEISISLGVLYLVPIAALFSFLLKKSKSKIIVIACLVGTIPYGLTSIYLIYYCYLSRFIIEFFVKKILIK